MLKAFLLQRVGRYPFIHSIRALLEECLRIDNDFSVLIKERVQKVGMHYTKARYPPLANISREEAVEAVKIAERVRDFVLAKLGGENIRSK